MIDVYKRQYPAYAGNMSGEILLEGKPLEDYPLARRARGVSILFQNPDDQFCMDRVDHEILFALENINYQGDLRARTRELLAPVSYTHLDVYKRQPLCRRAVRVSMGTIFQVPWARIGDCPEDWPQAGMELLHKNGFATAAMALDDRAISIDDVRLRQEEKLAVLLGTEGDGLSHQTIAHCYDTVMIPMEHGVDSLNVAAASAVAFGQLRAR